MTLSSTPVAIPLPSETSSLISLLSPKESGAASVGRPTVISRALVFFGSVRFFQSLLTSGGLRRPNEAVYDICNEYKDAEGDICQCFSKVMEENKVPAEDAKPEECQMKVQDSHGPEHPLKNSPDAHPELEETEVVTPEGNSENGNTLGDVNMEATITTDDVERAGGLGATDDISSFLPVAMDSTDFEASLRDAREFEGPQSEISRPGLGWKEPGGLE